MDRHELASLLVILMVTVGVTLSAADVRAACQYSSCQSDGAVNKPDGFDISLPFKNGEKVHILSGYGPTNGSGLHCRAKDSYCANDWHALDLTLPNHSNHGKGQPVLASASGEVIAAGWGSQGWANYGQRVYIEHDFNSDGHKYVTMYAHLDSVAVRKGQHVDKGDKLGTLGQSCQGSKKCSSFSTPHVHWALHRDSNFGGSGSGGSYGGRAVKPEPIDGHTGIKQGQNLTSKNGQSSNNNNNNNNNSGGCSVVISSNGGWVEEDSDCAKVVGTLDDTSGHAGHAYVGTQQSKAPNYAHGVIYRLNFEKAGDYRVFANLPSGVGNLSDEVIYKVSTPGGAMKVPVDHAANAGGEVNLGVYSFAKGVPDSQWVRVGDNYTDSANKGKKFILDGLRIEPKDGGNNCACNTQGAVETRPCQGGVYKKTCDGCQWSGWSKCIPKGGGGDTGTGNSPKYDTGYGGTTGGFDTGSNGGPSASDGGAPATNVQTTSACGCNSTGSPRHVPLSLLAFALAAIGIRRWRGR